MSPHELHDALLRPAIMHILRAAGFYGTRPSVLDTLTDLCARHLLLIASRTAAQVYDRTTRSTHSSSSSADASPPSLLDLGTPTVSDVRVALTSTHFFPATATASEEAWRESTLRRPLSSFPAGGARDKERRRRDDEDTADVRDFIDWVVGPVNEEIRRIAGLLPDDSDLAAAGAPGAGTANALADAADAAAQQVAAAGAAGAKNVARGTSAAADGAATAAADDAAARAAPTQRKDDYLTLLKKKHSKTGDEARYAGTTLGSAASQEDRATSSAHAGGGGGSARHARAHGAKHAADRAADAQHGGGLQIEGAPLDVADLLDADGYEWTLHSWERALAAHARGGDAREGGGRKESWDGAGDHAVLRKRRALQGDALAARHSLPNKRQAVE